MALLSFDGSYSFRPESNSGVYLKRLFYSVLFLTPIPPSLYLKFSLNSLLDQIVFYVYGRTANSIFMKMSQKLINWLDPDCVAPPPVRLCILFNSDALALLASHFLDWACALFSRTSTMLTLCLDQGLAECPSLPPLKILSPPNQKKISKGTTQSLGLSSMLLPHRGSQSSHGRKVAAPPCYRHMELNDADQVWLVFICSHGSRAVSSLKTGMVSQGPA